MKDLTLTLKFAHGRSLQKMDIKGPSLQNHPLPQRNSNLLVSTLSTSYEYKPCKPIDKMLLLKKVINKHLY